MGKEGREGERQRDSPQGHNFLLPGPASYRFQPYPSATGWRPSLPPQPLRGTTQRVIIVFFCLSHFLLEGCGKTTMADQEVAMPSPERPVVIGQSFPLTVLEGSITGFFTG